MQRLIVHNVGPIRDADIRLKKVNVFIGPQSSGKSTIAKIIAFCSWLEKNKHELEGSYLFTDSVIDKMITYHRMEGYISDDSQIFYQGIILKRNHSSSALRGYQILRFYIFQRREILYQLCPTYGNMMTQRTTCKVL